MKNTKKIETKMEKLFSMMKMMAFVLLEQEEELAQKQLMEMET
ncbi:hypothetical protein [Tenacibaculum sp. Bg11-29]|nr:hypothetical protein [Tenacibaculum sp. Bg11-29]